MIYEALDNGFVGSWYEKWWLDSQFQNGKMAIGECKKLTNVKINADKYLGRPYAWWDILVIVYSTFTGKTLRTRGEKSLICSEAVARILYDSSNKKINFIEEFGKPYDLIEPMDLAKSKQINWKEV